MEEDGTVAPAVESILASARERAAPARELSVEARSLPAAIEGTAADGRSPVIAEVKPTSPTTDGQREDDPVELARAMVDGGAAVLSVLTEPEHFGGSPDDLRAVREAVGVPVLRKDFVLREEQLDVVAADVVLLIARFVDDLPALIDAARARGFQVLVETHTRAELRDAIEAGATVVGVNNRDLAQLAVDLETFERVAPAVTEQVGSHPSPEVSAREDVTLIAESGISSVEDVERMRRAGADALLVGSAIMDGDVRENTRRLTRTSDTSRSDDASTTQR